MSDYPAALDSAATLYSSADAFSAKRLETTTTGEVGPGDGTINVASTLVGFAATYGILSIDDELVIYTSKTMWQFTGCIRGAFGTAPAGHVNGATVRANMVSGFITALQSAVVAVEAELGTVAARNYVRKDGAVTITGLKTFVDGAEFGAGNKARTGLVRLPNAGALKWRKADNSGDLGMALNGSNHIAMDAVIDFAAGQTFGAFSYPDASTTTKGIVQIDSTGGLAVAAGVLSVASSGVTPGTYTKLTVDAKGRATGGTVLASGDLPSHMHAESEITNLVSDLVARPTKGLGWSPSHAAVINSSGALEAAVGNADDCLLVDGSSAPKASASHTHASSDIVSWPYQSWGGDLENMLKRSEDFSSIWSTDGGSCTVASNTGDTASPDGNQTADKLTSNGDTAKIQQQIAGLTEAWTYTFYIWAKVASGTRKVSLAIADNAYSGYLAGPTQVTLTASWQRFKVTGTLAAGQTALWAIVRNYTGNSDEWTNETVIYLWGACLQAGSDPKCAYVRTWDAQVPVNHAGIALGATVISAANTSESPFTVYGPGSNLEDKMLFQVTSGGEIIVAGGTGNGYRLAELMGATNPSGWAGTLKVKTPAGATLGYLLLYANP